MRGTPKERLLSRCIPEPNSGCWLWLGAVSQKGYGVIGLGGRFQGQTGAHRLSYEIHKGPIAAGLTIDHKCRVRCCINPDHLECVSLVENVHRRWHGEDRCMRGHLFTPENTHFRKNRKQRECRTCMAWRSRMARHGKEVQTWDSSPPEYVPDRRRKGAGGDRWPQ